MKQTNSCESEVPRAVDVFLPQQLVTHFLLSVSLCYSFCTSVYQSVKLQQYGYSTCGKLLIYLKCSQDVIWYLSI